MKEQDPAPRRLARITTVRRDDVEVAQIHPDGGVRLRRVELRLKGGDVVLLDASTIRLLVALAAEAGIESRRS